MADEDSRLPCCRCLISLQPQFAGDRLTYKGDIDMPRKKSGGRKYSRRAGQEVRTEMHHMRSGKHKVKNRKQAIAIGLSKARQKGIKVPKKKAA
jgi:hypothetical protein